MKQVDWAYLAGLFDGDGYITIGKTTSKRLRPTYSIIIGIHSTNREVLEKLQKMNGNIGALNIQKCSDKSKNKLPLWHWCIRSKQAQTLLISINPFLQMKKKQASLCLEFGGSMKRFGRKGMPDIIRIKREKIRNEIKRLNKKGGNYAKVEG